MSSQTSLNLIPVTPTSAHAANVIPLIARLLRVWCADAPAEDCARLVGWLEGIAGPMLESILGGFELYRRDQWLQYATGAATVWARWTGGELERAVYEILPPGSPAANRLRLRREEPFGAEEVGDFLDALAGAEEASKLQDRKAWLLRGVIVDVLYEAACHAGGAAGDGEDALAPLRRLHQRQRGEAIRSAALRRLALLDQPPPGGLRACLHQLLLPAERVEGCLTAAYRLRLFRQLAEVAEPLVPREAFAVAQGAVESLCVGSEQETAPAGTLREMAARVTELRRFACRVRPVLAGPAAGAHREWLRHLLENFERLGLLAACLLGETSAPAGEGELLSPGTTVRAAEPEPQRKEPSPDDAALTALAARHPEVEAYLAIVALSEELLPAVQRGWPDAEEALKGLHYPGSRFRQKLLRAVSAPPDEQGRLIGEAARQLADEFVNRIRRLDALLPGAGAWPPPFKGPAGLAPAAREQLAHKLKALRDRVFEVMRSHGGYDEYPVAVGDSVRKHGVVLDDVTYVSGPRLRPDEIVQVLEPGYVRRREDGQQELIRSPKVLVAR
jgi:hypothetical protein